MNLKPEPLGQANALAEENPRGSLQAKWAAIIDDKFVPAPQRRVEVKVLMDQSSNAPGNILVRDLGGEHDVPLRDGQSIDLAEGNVFYTVPECEAPKPTGHAPPKLAFFVDDRPEETLRADQTGRLLRELFGFAADVLLFRDYESPNDEPIGLEEPVSFGDGPVFYSRRHKPHTITITINGKPYELTEHKAQVKELKKLAGIPLADVLVQIVAGQMTPLDDNGVVELHCGDVFVSHPRDNASS